MQESQENTIKNTMNTAKYIPICNDYMTPISKFYRSLPFVATNQNEVKGPLWLHFLNYLIRLFALYLHFRRNQGIHYSLILAVFIPDIYVAYCLAVPSKFDTFISRIMPSLTAK